MYVVLQGLKIVSHMVDSSVGIGDDRHTWEPSSFSTFRWCAVCQTMLRGRGGDTLFFCNKNQESLALCATSLCIHVVSFPLLSSVSSQLL